MNRMRRSSGSALADSSPEMNSGMASATGKRGRKTCSPSRRPPRGARTGSASRHRIARASARSLRLPCNASSSIAGRWNASSSPAERPLRGAGGPGRSMGRIPAPDQLSACRSARAMTVPSPGRACAPPKAPLVYLRPSFPPVGRREIWSRTACFAAPRQPGSSRPPCFAPARRRPEPTTRSSRRARNRRARGNRLHARQARHGDHDANLAQCRESVGRPSSLLASSARS